MREVLMSQQRFDKCAGGEGGRERLSLPHPSSNARVLSIDRGNGTPKETLESLLSSALRSDDTELDQILSTLEEISKWLNSGAPNVRSVDNALQRVASCALKQSLLDREI